MVGYRRSSLALRRDARLGGYELAGGYTEAAALIDAALTSSLMNYSVVSLDVVGRGPGVGVTFVPTSYTGTWDRSVERDFGFDVTVEGLAAGVYDFEVVARVDGSIVARETDHITVLGGGEVPEPATFAVLGGGLIAMLAVRRRRRA